MASRGELADEPLPGLRGGGGGARERGEHRDGVQEQARGTYMPISRVCSAGYEARAPETTARAWIWTPRGRWDAETQPRRSASRRSAEGPLITAAAVENAVVRHGRRGGGLRRMRARRMARWMRPSSLRGGTAKRRTAGARSGQYDSRRRFSHVSGVWFRVPRHAQLT
jgi:hypothetical protein